MDKEQGELYSLPLTLRSGMKPWMHLVFVVLIAFFSLFLFIPSSDVGGTIVRVFSLIIILFFLYSWLFTGVLKMGMLRLDEQGVLLKLCFGIRRIAWNEIAGVESYMQNGVAAFGIVTKKWLKKRKQNFLHALWESLGGLYTFSIPLTTFPTADAERLYATMVTMVAKAQGSSHPETPVQEEDLHSEPPGQETAAQTSPPTKSSVFRVLLTSLLLALGVGVVNGLLMMPFSKGTIALSSLGLIGLLYIHQKADNNALKRLWVRFLFGLICSLQVLVAPFIHVMTFVYKAGMFSSFGARLKTTFTYILKDSSVWVPVAALAGLCFVIGFINGMTYKMMRRIKQRFMKQKNGFYIKKNKRFVSLYAIDYALIDESQEKQCVMLGPNNCLIEKSGRDIDAFYLPEGIASEYGVTSNFWRKVTVDDEQYYMFDLGSCGQPRKYGYNCQVILGPNKEVEVICLEID